MTNSSLWMIYIYMEQLNKQNYSYDEMRKEKLRQQRADRVGMANGKLNQESLSMFPNFDRNKVKIAASSY